MGYLMDDGLEPEAAAVKAITEEPARLENWLAGVATFDGKPGLEAVRQGLGL
jgi:glycine betaine/proline transport system substrate-binding protein